MKTSNLWLAGLIGFGLAGVLPSAGAQTLLKIADTGTITVSYRAGSVPFSYLVEPGKPAGFAMDLTAAIVDDVRKKLDRPSLQVSYLAVTPQNRIPLLANGSYDLECGSTTNNVARGKEVSFAISHFFAGTRVLVKKESGITSYSDLSKKTVTTVSGSTNEKVIRKYSDENRLEMQIAPAKDYDEAFLQLDSGKAAALALDDVLLFGLRAGAGNPAAFEVIGETLQVEPYGCMVRKDDPEFKQLVDGTLARLMKTGEFERLYAKWFQSPIPPKGVNLDMPMNEPLKANLRTLSDQPVM
jgi:ABC-type amino acid transport substrate-binding protein